MRPYPGRLGSRIMSFVEEQGYELIPHGVLAPGTLDLPTARWVTRCPARLIVIPFHLHRGPGGEVLDGVGALAALDQDLDLSRVAFFMPVRSFSWGASFQRRLSVLQEELPWIAERLLVAHQDDLGTATLRSKMRRFLYRAESLLPPSPSSWRPSAFPPGDSSFPAEPEFLKPGVLSREDRFHSSPPASGEVLTREQTGPERTPDSAAESFRRAAEIGARTRRLRRA